MEFDGANNIQPFFVIRKSCNNSYELFYMSGKWTELLSSVTSCDLFFFLVVRCDFSYLAMNCNCIWYTTT
jgi:hypothetical protein